MKVLVVEDLMPAFIGVNILLNEYGMTADHALDGQTGVEMAQKSHYDLILMDLGLPILNGIEATSHIRQFDTKTPIFALTANLREYSQEKLCNLGMEGGYEKPFTEYKLAHLLLRARLVLSSRENALLNRLPGLDNRDIAFEYTGYTDETLLFSRPYLLSKLSSFEHELTESMKNGDWKIMNQRAYDLYDYALHSASLRLALAGLWLYLILSKNAIVIDRVSYHLQLVIQSIHAFKTAYAIEYE